MADPFYYLDASNTPVGPMSLGEIGNLVANGLLPHSVQVCPAGETEWKPLITHWGQAASPLSSKPLSTKPSISRPEDPEAGDPWPKPWFPVVSLVFGVVAVVGSCVPIVGILLAVASLILGFSSLRHFHSSQRRQALAGVICSFAAMLLSVAIWGYTVAQFNQGNPGAGAIEEVLQTDMRIAKNAKNSYRYDLGGRARFITREMQRIDLAKCPPEFRVAFQRHVNAWNEAIPYIAADNAANAFLEGLYSGYTQDYSALGWSHQQAQLAAYQIAQTYEEVLTVAAAYGARIPVQ
ncbi:MAG: hypothetical protein KDM63_04945 [Verrucomicrobiae bacterium]|nr:hypothetical protein [Verrucomicrobiae bacterium]